MAAALQALARGAVVARAAAGSRRAVVAARPSSAAAQISRRNVAAKVSPMGLPQPAQCDGIHKIVPA